MFSRFCLFSVRQADLRRINILGFGDGLAGSSSRCAGFRGSGAARLRFCPGRGILESGKTKETASIKIGDQEGNKILDAGEGT
jgi:hypothetical protein